MAMVGWSSIQGIWLLDMWAQSVDDRYLKHILVELQLQSGRFTSKVDTYWYLWHPEMRLGLEKHDIVEHRSFCLTGTYSRSQCMVVYLNSNYGEGEMHLSKDENCLTTNNIVFTGIADRELCGSKRRTFKREKKSRVENWRERERKERENKYRFRGAIDSKETTGGLMMSRAKPKMDYISIDMRRQMQEEDEARAMQEERQDAALQRKGIQRRKARVKRKALPTRPGPKKLIVYSANGKHTTY